MALKDWKQVRKMLWKKKMKTLMVTGFSLNYPNRYLVRVIDDSGWISESTEVMEEFNSKSAALKFARAYMRTH